MATELELLKIQMEADFHKFDKAFAKATGKIDKGLGRIEKHVGRTSTSVQALFAGMGAYVSTHELKEYADAWIRVERAVAATQDIFGMQLRSAQGLSDLAMDARSDLEAYAKLYTRTAVATEELGLAEEKVARVTSTVAKSLKLGSAAASEQASTMLQLSQALNKGKLDGDEFRSVMENAPVIQKALADSLNVSKGALLDMAAKGKIKVNDLIDALLKIEPAVNKAFADAPVTIDEAMTNLRTGITKYIGERDKAFGGSQALAGALQSTAANFDTLGDSAVVAGAAILAATGPKAVAGLARLGVGASLALGPFGLVAGAIVGLGVALGLFGDDVKLFEGDIASLADYAAVAFDLVKEGGAVASAALESAFVGSISMITQMLGGVPVTMADILGAIKVVLNALVGAFVFARDNIYNNWATLPRALAELMTDQVNQTIRTVEYMINGIVSLIDQLIRKINHVSGAVAGFSGVDLGKLGFVGQVDLGKIENQFRGAGKTAGEAFGKAFQTDYIGNAFDEIKRRAAEKAFTPSVQTGGQVPSRTGAVRPGQAGASEEDFKKIISGLQQQVAAIDQRDAALGRSTAEQARLNAAYQLENTLREKGIELTPEQREEMEGVLDMIYLTTVALEDKKTRLEENQQAMKELQEIGGVAVSALESGLNQFIENGKVDFQGLIDSMLKELAKLLVQLLIIQPLMAALTGGGSLGGGLLSSAVGGFGGFFANGGQPPVGKWSIVGEKGPEIFVPKTAGTIYPSGTMPAMAGGGSGDTNVNLNYTIDARGADSAQIAVLRQELQSTRANLKNDVLSAVQSAKRRFPGRI